MISFFFLWFALSIPFGCLVGAMIRLGDERIERDLAWMDSPKQIAPGE